MATVRGMTQLFENPLVEGLERLPVTRIRLEGDPAKAVRDLTGGL